jgi:ubiquinone biosynthesis monooxygenase Coq7
MRNFKAIDHCINQFNHSLQTLLGPRTTTQRENPANFHPEADLTVKEKRHIAGLMRVNHAGEIAAQGLYQGQALTASDKTIVEQMKQAAIEENDHLAWCEQRLTEMNSHSSYLKPVWYVGSLMMGSIAGLCGDRWSLGFVHETERQVAIHLTNHLEQLPALDTKSRAIVLQMRTDEQQHARQAWHAGAAKLPAPIQFAMHWVAKIMTKSAYWV